MSLNVGKTEYEQYAYVKKVEDKGSYALVQLSTSRKDKKLNKSVYSNWSYVRFVGNAYKDIVDVEPGTAIVVKAMSIENTPYEKDGQTIWPKSPQFTVFAWELSERNNNQSEDAPPVVEEDEEDEIPF